MAEQTEAPRGEMTFQGHAASEQQLRLAFLSPDLKSGLPHRVTSLVWLLMLRASEKSRSAI